MPELAEVETVRRQIAKRMVSKKIKDVILGISPETDRYLFAFASSTDVIQALKGAKVMGTGRKGKYFWLELNRKPWPIFHLGMSGNVVMLDLRAPDSPPERIWGGAQLWTARNTEFERRLKFCRLLLKMNDGLEMAFIDPRRFGRMWLTDHPLTHPRISALGYDPLLDFPEAKILGEHLARRKMAIKPVLLDQALFAGIGNWLADEILYQARISPHRLASQLAPPEIRRLRQKILLVINQAVAVQADYEQFPANWLFHHRWGEKKEARTSRGQLIIRETIAGRTAAWVKGWQK